MSTVPQMNIIFLRRKMLLRMKILSGQRYIRHREYGSKVSLLVREFNSDCVTGRAKVCACMGAVNLHEASALSYICNTTKINEASHAMMRSLVCFDIYQTPSYYVTGITLRLPLLLQPDFEYSGTVEELHYSRKG